MVTAGKEPVCLLVFVCREDLRNVHVVHRILLVERSDGGVHCLLHVQGRCVQLSAHQHQGCLFKGGGTIQPHRDQSGLLCLVAVSAAVRAAELEDRTIRLGQEGHGEQIVLLHQLKGFPGCTDVCGQHVFPPEDTHLSPGSGHRIVAIRCAACEQKPFLSNFGKGVQRQLLHFGFDKCHFHLSLVNSQLRDCACIIYCIHHIIKDA